MCFSILAALRTLFLPYGQPATAPQIIINEDPIRPELQTLYANKVVSDFIYQKARFDYVYQALVNPAVGKPFLAFGGEESVSLVVSEAVRIVAGSGSGTTLDTHSIVSFAGQIFADNVAMPRGYRDANICTAGSVANSAGPEVAIPSASYANEPTYDFLGGQIYEAVLTIAVSLSAATDSATVIRIRKGSATTVGTILCVWSPDISSAGNAQPGTKTLVGYIMNTGTATVSTKLSITNNRAAGAANISLYGDATIPASLTVKHIGRINDQGGLSLIAGSV